MNIEEVPSIRAARRDHATVTKEGHDVSRVIDGVITRTPPTHTDHRGTVFEIFNDDPFYWSDPVVYCYQFSVHPGQVKGWGLHEHKVDRYTLIRGDVLTLLHDARPDSPTYGLTQKVALSERGLRQLLIPRYVWHLNIALGPSEAVLINHPTERYVHDNPDRMLLPPDTDVIPVDVYSLFPVQWRATMPPGNGTQ
jgi:dTDP-4-dehydrorhamnose 3,5-epimerase